MSSCASKPLPGRRRDISARRKKQLVSVLLLTTDPYFRAAIEALDYLQEANAAREPAPMAVDNVAAIEEHRPEPAPDGDDTLEFSL